MMNASCGRVPRRAENENGAFSRLETHQPAVACDRAEACRQRPISRGALRRDYSTRR